MAKGMLGKLGSSSGKSTKKHSGKSEGETFKAAVKKAAPKKDKRK